MGKLGLGYHDVNHALQRILMINCVHTVHILRCMYVCRSVHQALFVLTLYLYDAAEESHVRQ